jgi:hypothetical protein
MALPRRRTPRPIHHRPVLAALKAKPCGRRGRAGLDRHCARAASKMARRDEETLPPPNQETGHLPAPATQLCLSLKAMAKED